MRVQWSRILILHARGSKRLETMSVKLGAQIKEPGRGSETVMLKDVLQLHGFQGRLGP